MWLGAPAALGREGTTGRDKKIGEDGADTSESVTTDLSTDPLVA